jgi:serine/threonine protein kinase
VPLELGSVFGGYLLEEEVGRGGMGVVYRARNVITEREVALKVLTPAFAQDIQFRARFKRESRLAARLDHEHVIPLHHAGEEEGLLYLVMRLIDGTDLHTLIVERGVLAPDLAVEIVAQVAGALDAAHADGLIHRDVKPANVLIEGDGGGRAYLTDFGLVKELSSDSSLTETGAFLGTYHYAAPEQFDSGFGQVSPRTDIYALGCVLYHCLTGTVPYPRDTPGAIIAAHLFQEPPDVRAARPELPAALTAVLGRALSKKPGLRHATASEFVLAVAIAAKARASTPRADAPDRQGGARDEGQDAAPREAEADSAQQPTAERPHPTPDPRMAPATILGRARLAADRPLVSLADAPSPVLVWQANESQRQVLDVVSEDVPVAHIAYRPGAQTAVATTDQGSLLFRRGEFGKTVARDQASGETRITYTVGLLGRGRFRTSDHRSFPWNFVADPRRYEWEVLDGDRAGSRSVVLTKWVLYDRDGNEIARLLQPNHPPPAELEVKLKAVLSPGTKDRDELGLLPIFAGFVLL